MSTKPRALDLIAPELLDMIIGGTDWTAVHQEGMRSAREGATTGAGAGAIIGPPLAGAIAFAKSVPGDRLYPLVLAAGVAQVVGPAAGAAIGGAAGYAYGAYRNLRGQWK